MPDPKTGELLVDPDIQLRAKDFDLAISFFYSSTSDEYTSFGRSRSSSLDAMVSVEMYPVSAGVYRREVISMTRGDLTSVNGGLMPDGANYRPPAPPGGASNFTILDDGALEVFQTGMDVYYDQKVYGWQVVGADPIWGPALMANFRIASIAHANGAVQYYDYDDDFRLLNVREAFPSGRMITLTYGPSLIDISLVSSVEDWGGRLTTFEYDANGYLTTMTTPLGCTTKYTYSLAGSPVPVLHTIEDPRGYRTTYMYDDLRRVVSMAAGDAVWTWIYGVDATSSMMTPSGALTTYYYDQGNGNLLAQAYPEGYTTTFGYDSFRRKVLETTPVGQTMSVTYGSRGRIATSVDPLGNRTEYAYVGNDFYPTSITDALGHVTTITYDPGVYFRAKTRKDPLGRITTYTDAYGSQQCPRGYITTVVLGAYGLRTGMLYADGTRVTAVNDVLGRPVSVQDQLGRTTHYEYDAADHIVSTTNPAGENTRYIYDSCFLIAEVDPLGYRTSYTYDRLGNRTAVWDALGNYTTTTYDNQGYPYETIYPDGTRTTIVYNAARQRIADVDQLGFRTTYAYDVVGRLVSTIDANGAVTTNIYNARDQIATQDALGNLWTTVYDALGRPVETLTPLGYLSLTTYDSAGQVVFVTDALDHSTGFQYDLNGNRTTITDGNGNSTATVYEDLNDRALATVDALGYRTTFSYDLAGQQIGRLDARGNRIGFAYDLAGRQTSIANELGYITTYAYDKIGRNTWILDASGRRKTMTYDALSRAVVVQNADGFVTFSYDLSGNLGTMVDVTGRTTYAYSARGELIRKSEPGPLVQTYAYDAVGNRTLLVDPDGKRTTSTYDSLGRVAAIARPNGRIYTMQYDADGRRTTMQLGLGSTRKYAYDAEGRLTTQVEVRPNGTTIDSMIDAYDAVGNRTSRNKNGETTSWDYDDNYRLISQHVFAGYATFTYDEVGNVLSKQHQGQMPISMSYDPASRLTTSAQGRAVTTYTYDALGNLVMENAVGMLTTYTYDAESRLNGVFIPSSKAFMASHTYGGDGLRRQSFEDSSGLTVYVWDGSDYLQERLTEKTNAAMFVSQTVPGIMTASSVVSISLTFLNRGNGTWTAANNYKLGTQAPQDNHLWVGSSRVTLGAGDSIAPGQSKTFTFNVTAPSTTGTYAMQWRMVQDGVAWFGDMSPMLFVEVV